MRAALVGFLGDHREKVQVGGRDRVPGFFVCFARRALEGRFAGGQFQFAANRTPGPEVGRLVAEDEQQFSRRVLDEDQDRQL